MDFLFILNDPPYGTERTYNGLRLASSLVRGNPTPTVGIFLMADAVFSAKRGQQTPNGYYNLERMLRGLASKGAEILLCGTCMESRGLTDGELLDGARRSSLDELTARTRTADRILVF